ncbi:MAG: GntR family transcriptional regulator [Firmicutes bacterium HGW-Firmicutes-15]|nr:MAG: GntR family transcriptional regulator [Firmicutes bacterium HGW-Firmicutes-15]
MSFHPIKTKRIYEEIVEQLKGMISRGDLQPGNKLPAERDMAESLGVSRASVREALTALETMGILDIRPGEGTFVRRTSDSETFEPLALLLAFERNPEAQMMEVRRILETECAALAAVRATQEDLQKIEASLFVMKTANSISEAVDADLRFHFAIAEATKNTVLLRIMNTVSDLMHNTFRQARENLYANPSLGPRVISEHEAINKAIQERKPEEAWAKMLEHINNIESGINHASPL